MSRLKEVLSGGYFAVTAECGPPKGSDGDVVLRKAGLLKGKVDAVNVTDNQTAIVRMSSLAGCLVLRGAGFDPVLQVVVRDRNRIALQSDILGACALGIGNVLCLSGDHQSFGNQPEAVGVFEELVFRGYLHAFILKYTESPVAIVVVSSIAFGLIHWSLGLHAVLITAVISSIFMIAYLRTRSLPAIMLAHFMINFIDFAGVIPKSIFRLF